MAFVRTASIYFSIGYVIFKAKSKFSDKLTVFFLKKFGFFVQIQKNIAFIPAICYNDFR